MNKSIITYEIYTDGSAKGTNPAHKSGGWAYCILYDGDLIRKDSGHVNDTTNQRMELTAAADALEALQSKQVVTSVTETPSILLDPAPESAIFGAAVAVAVAGAESRLSGGTPA